MDIVFIKELCIETVIGIYDWERKIKQFVCIDLELGTDISNASNSDVIDDTVDYKAVSKTLKTFIGDSEFQLIEALAEESTELYTHGDFQLDYSARRSFLSAKEDATLSAAEIEAEARRVFAEFDANIDRRIDKAELGELRDVRLESDRTVVAACGTKSLL